MTCATLTFENRIVLPEFGETKLRRTPCRRVFRNGKISFLQELLVHPGGDGHTIICADTVLRYWTGRIWENYSGMGRTSDYTAQYPFGVPVVVIVEK